MCQARRLPRPPRRASPGQPRAAARLAFPRLPRVPPAPPFTWHIWTSDLRHPVTRTRYTGTDLRAESARRVSPLISTARVAPLTSQDRNVVRSAWRIGPKIVQMTSKSVARAPVRHPLNTRESARTKSRHTPAHESPPPASPRLTAHEVPRQRPRDPRHAMACPTDQRYQNRSSPAARWRMRNAPGEVMSRP